MTRKRCTPARILGVAEFPLVVLTLLIAILALGQRTAAGQQPAITPDTPIFRGPTVYDSGGGLARTVAVADLNGDGKPDLVVVNYSGSYYGSNVGSVGVLLGKGNGTFLPAVVYGSGGGGPNGIVIGDLNGDGKNDLVVANQGCPGVVSFCLGVLLGKGDGTFQPVVIYADGGWSWGGGTVTPIMIADLNGDGKPDLLVVSQTDRNYGHGLLGVLLGNGDGTFKPVGTYDSGGFAAYSGVLADVNGDGKVDVVVGNCTASGYTDCLSNEAAVVGVLLGNGDGTFQAVRKYGTGGVGGFWVPLVVADVSSDGKPDILVGNYCPNNNCAAGRGSLGVLLGNGDGTFQLAVTYDPGPHAAVVSIAVADLNGDGKLDVVVGAPMGVFMGNGDGTFQPVTTVPASGASQVFAADLNHDGKPDLVGITVGSADVLLGNGDGTFQGAQNYKLGGSQSSWATLADVDADGKPDLVAANSCCRPFLYEEGTVGVLLNIFKNATAATLASSLNPSIYGQAVTWTAMVTTSGSVLPTGEVSFTWNGHSIGTVTLDASGMATLTKSNLNADPYPLTAVYIGDTYNATSTSTILNQVVTQTTSSIQLTSSPNPSSSGQAVTFTATITSPTVLPTGPVTFAVGKSVLGTAQLGGGKAKFSISTLAVGSTKVTATYYGDSNIAKSSASVTQTVHQ
jgi:hypothetical protein